MAGLVLRAGLLREVLLMLAEIALTPQVLDEDGQPDLDRWATQLKALMRRLKPRGGLQPLIVSDLYGGSLQHELKMVVGRNRRHPVARRDAQQLWEMLRKLLLHRPAHADPYPENEVDWLIEARA